LEREEMKTVLELSVGDIVRYGEQIGIVEVVHDCAAYVYVYAVRFTHDRSIAFTAHGQRFTHDCESFPRLELVEKKEKPKKRYWAWKIKHPGIGYWHRVEDYVDEQGIRTDGKNYLLGGNETWSSIDKIKIEDDFVEV
jgi:hypothetical protein